MLSAAAGRWIVTVTNTSDREISYDLNSFAAAKAGAPLTPGTAPRSISDEGLSALRGRRVTSTSMRHCARCSGNLLVAPAVAVDGLAVQRDDSRQSAAVGRCLLECAAAPGRARKATARSNRSRRRHRKGRVSKRSLGVG